MAQRPTRECVSACRRLRPSDWGPGTAIQPHSARLGTRMHCWPIIFQDMREENFVFYLPIRLSEDDLIEIERFRRLGRRSSRLVFADHTRAATRPRWKRVKMARTKANKFWQKAGTQSPDWSHAGKIHLTEAMRWSQRNTLSGKVRCQMRTEAELATTERIMTVQELHMSIEGERRFGHKVWKQLRGTCGGAEDIGWGDGVSGGCSEGVELGSFVHLSGVAWKRRLGLHVRDLSNILMIPTYSRYTHVNVFL